MTQLSLALLAYHSLILEATLDFKPGLVCLNSNGSHTDMNHDTFMISAKALYPHFQQYERLGKENVGSLEQLFMKLRKEGMKAEESMLLATNGINTHKGANFIFALLIGATSMHFQHHNALVNLKSTIQTLASSVAFDFKAINDKESLTHGEKVYLKYKTKGIRQEALDGFPVLFDYEFSKLTDSPHTWYEFLLGCMSVLDDTTILHRCGQEGLEFTKKTASSLAVESLINNFELVNKEFVSRNISPGGSADFLSAALYLRSISNYQTIF